MNIPITQIFSIVMLTLLLQASLSSCSGHDEPNLPKVTPQIVFLFSPGGLGDMSYNDCILEGVQHFKKENAGWIFSCIPLINLRSRRKSSPTGWHVLQVTFLCYSSSPAATTTNW